MGSNDSGSASGEVTKNSNIHHQQKILRVPAPDCCIYRVPKKLRKIKEEAYTPHLISIGPFHRDNKDLVDMETQKERYKDEFVERIDGKKFEKLESFLEKEEQRIRNCYAEACELESKDFRKMILYDAVFIIELFLRYDSRNEYGGDFLIQQKWLTNAIKLDLQLLENQLPYFVLKELYRLAFGSPTAPPFLSLCCRFFDFKVASESCTEQKWKHLLAMRRFAMVQFLPKQADQGTSREVSIEEGATKEGSTEEGTIQDLPCAVMLDESGLWFEPVPTSKSGTNRLLEIKFTKRKRYIPFFNGVELQIPRIVIEDCTECLMRNLMALEQCCYPSATHICNYVDLIDSLINTRKDVDLLVEKGIISNRVGDHTSISEMFNKLCLQITTSDSCYEEIIGKLRAHHDRWWNRTKATLRSVYFRDIWRGTATAAAALFLLLALLQTMQRLWGGWTPPKK